MRAPAWSRAQWRSWRAPLHEEHVSPDAVNLPKPLPRSDHPESAALVEVHARDVLGEDPALDRPDAGGIRMRDQGFEQAATDASAAHTRVDIHAVLEHARVDAALRHGGGGHPADDDPVAPRDETVLGRMGDRPALKRRHLGLEGGVAGCDSLGVDGVNRRPVVVAKRPDLDTGGGRLVIKVHDHILPIDSLRGYALDVAVARDQ